MSPGIELDIHSIGGHRFTFAISTRGGSNKFVSAFDEKNNLLYVTMTQDFRIWIVPGYRAPVTLTSVLKLVKQYDKPDQHPVSHPHPESQPNSRRESQARPRRLSLPSQNPSDRHVQFSRLPPSPLSRETTITLGSSEDTVIHESEANENPRLNYAAGRSTTWDDLPSPRRPERQHSYTSPLSTPQDRTRISSRDLYYIQSQDDLYQTSEFVKFVMPFGIGTAVVLFWHVFATVFSVLGVVFWWPLVMLEEKGLVGLVPGNINRRVVGGGKEVMGNGDIYGPGERGRMRDGEWARKKG